jgi:hypothetical protein
MHFARSLPLLLLASAALLNGPSRRVSDIPAPSGCSRTELAAGSYAAWLRGLPIKDGCEILAYDGSRVETGSYRVLAVLGLPLMFREDLEQCADWCFRLWAEFHRESGNLGSLRLFDYSGRRRGFAGSGKTYRKFLRWTMANANSHSLLQGCLSVDPADLMPGDMLVQNRDGGVGHVSLIMDACRDSTGGKYYLIGYGYMPAQEFHIERADTIYGRDGWFSLEGYLRYLGEYFDYGEPALRRVR